MPIQDTGVLISVDESSGKFLGLPQDGGFVPLDVALDYMVYVPNGIENDIASYTIIKRYVTYEVTDSATIPVYSDWADITTVTELPYEFSYTTEANFYEGLTVTSADLQVGDYFEFSVRVTKTDGSEYYPNADGVIKITVNCLSDLAGVYVLDGLYTRTSSGITNQPYHNDAEVIYELAPGEYMTSTSGHWAPGDLAPGNDGFVFLDVCGVITIEEQYLGDYWANVLAGSGTVDAATGDLHFEYTVCFGGDCREYVADYVKTDAGAFAKSKVEATENIDPNNFK